MKTDDVIFVGLAAGYLVWLLVEHAETVPIWSELTGWWYRRTEKMVYFAGKPFSCTICMAFWLSLLLHYLNVIVYGGAVDLVSVFASAGIALWFNADLVQRSTMIIKT